MGIGDVIVKKNCEAVGMVIHSILLNAPIQAKLLDLCALNFKFLFCLCNQKEEIGILNSMYMNLATWLVLVY